MKTRLSQRTYWTAVAIAVTVLSGCAASDAMEPVDGETAGSEAQELVGGFPLRSHLNGKCIDIKDWDPNNGAAVIMYGCHGGANQRWYWDGPQIRSDMHGKCLDVLNWDPAGAIIMHDCHGGANQRWYHHGETIRSELNGKCLEIVRWDPNDGARLQLYDCHAGANQRWDEY